MITFKAGDRVQTPLGAGTVQDFEAFDENGKQAANSPTDNGRRVRVKLDDPTKWAAHETHGDPYMFRSELSRAIGHTFRNGSKRVVYQPDWSAAQPWVTYTNGTAGRHFATERHAVEWLNQ
jgi:hypothetical protein